MNYRILIIALFLSGCSANGKKTGVAGATSLTFNGFVMGTPMDTLMKQVSAKPTLQTEDELDYQNITIEGVRWNQVTYNFLGGQLARATAVQTKPDAASYRTLYGALSTKYGKPAQNIDSLTIWTRRDAELSLQPGSILFSRR